MRDREIIKFIWEDDVWTAICEDLSVFGQGKTPGEAADKVSKAIDSYLKYISD